MYVEFQPLSYVYTENCEPVTSSHFLLGRNLQGHWFSTTTGDENIELNVMKYKNHCNHLLKLINDLWKRFKSEYLSEIREQQMYNYRRYSDAEKLVLNDMVLTKDDDITPRNKWKKGVIDELIKSSDAQRLEVLRCVYVPKPVK